MVSSWENFGSSRPYAANAGIGPDENKTKKIKGSAFFEATIYFAIPLP